MFAQSSFFHLTVIIRAVAYRGSLSGEISGRLVMFAVLVSVLHAAPVVTQNSALSLNALVKGSLRLHSGGCWNSAKTSLVASSGDERNHSERI